LLEKNTKKYLAINLLPTGDEFHSKDLRKPEEAKLIFAVSQNFQHALDNSQNREKKIEIIGKL
jgi:hypothetical protein